MIALTGQANTDIHQFYTFMDAGYVQQAINEFRL
jgi:hypothetical protein